MSNLASPVAMSPTHSPVTDFPTAPPPTPLCDPLAASPTRVRNGSAPSPSHAGGGGQMQRLSNISVQVSRLAASLDGECVSGSEEEKEESTASPLSSSSSSGGGYGSSGGAGSGSGSSPFTSFSARLAAARRKSPIPRLEIKIDNNDEQQPQQQQQQAAGSGKPLEESKANDQQQPSPLTRGDSGMSVSTPFGAKTPQNSPAAPVTPSGADSLPYHYQQLPSAAFNSTFSSSAFVPTTPSSAAGGRRGWTQLASYQPITPAGSPAAPMTPLPQQMGGGGGMSFASSPIPITPTPLMQREQDPPPTPNSAASAQQQRAHMPQQQQQVSPSPYSSHLPPTKLVQRAVSVGAVQPSHSPVRRAYMQDAVPNTPLDLVEPATPVCSPNPLYALSDKSFTVGLASIPPSPSVFLGGGGGGVGQRRGWKEPAGVPNTPASPSWQLPSPSAGSGSTLTFASLSPASPTTLAAIHEVDTPQDHSPNPFTAPKQPTPPTTSTSDPAGNSSGRGAATMAASSMSNALLTPAIAYFLTLIRTLHRSGRLSDGQRELLKDQLLSTAAPFLAVFALTMDGGITGKQSLIEAALVAMTAGSSPTPQPQQQQQLTVYHSYGFDSVLPITVDNHSALLRGIQALGLNRISVADLWSAFESESGFDELTQPAFLSCITSLLASSSSYSSYASASPLPLKQRISHFLTLYTALRASRNNQPAYVSWSYLFTSLAVLCQASADEKLTLVFQLLDGDGNNSVRGEQCREWLDCTLLLCSQLAFIGGGSASAQRESEVVAGVGRKEVKRLTEGVWQRSSGGLKGKVNLSRFLQWDANAVRIVHQLCDTLYP